MLRPASWPRLLDSGTQSLLFLCIAEGIPEFHMKVYRRVLPLTATVPMLLSICTGA